MNEENKSKIDNLRDYLKKGFLLHGSNSDSVVKVLEPRQASDINERVTGSQFAIYAEKDDIRIPIVMALLSKKDTTKDGWKSFYHSDGETFKTGGSNATFTSGLIYVLPGDTFERISDSGDDDFEYISRKPVVPFDVIKVDSTIIDLLDIEIEFDD